MGFKWIGMKRKRTVVEGVAVNPVKAVAVNSVVGIRIGRIYWKLN